tara:strand:- start:25306 stop:25680 length:375 start_codon:yes stop_codon:yes gene_type:complete
MKTQIKNDMVQAMKDKDIVARDVLRVVLGEIERTDDADVTKIVKKLIESIKLTGEDNGEIVILEEYLPKQMANEDILFIATSYIAEHQLESPREMGRVMGYFKKTYAGTYDGKVLSGIVKNLLV